MLNNGHKSKLEKLHEDDPRMKDLEIELGHRAGFEPWVATPLVTDNAFPTSLRLGGGNGGEYRKTFHGYPPNYVQIVESPTESQITPMQIDTW